ncbi:cytochrome P450 [Marasmius fiardii PR-910]|nr:cytochrome P450 [Marasmius fiardii PR-910]
MLSEPPSYSRRSQLPLPPGPRRIPILGNLYDMPSSFPGRKFEAMGKELGKSIVVLNSIRATEDLLEKRSAIYSSRPRFTMSLPSNGDGTVILFIMPYGNDWKAHRRMFQQENYRDHLRLSVSYPLRDLPVGLDFSLQVLPRMAGSLMISVTYGLETKDKNDQYIRNAENALDAVLPAMNPGTFLVDSLPFLKHIPSWFPGAGFKRKAKEWQALYHKMVNEAFDATKREIANGTAEHSFVSNSFQQLPTDPSQRAEMETLIRETAASMYEAGTDTVFTGLVTFFLAMTCFPEYAAKAQQEIDRVVGRDRLPDFADRESLPYCEAIMQEVFRWQPIAPVGIVHYTHVEDEYRGYRIPKNSTIIPNIWAILHDETAYPDPYTFNPERWLTGTTLPNGKTKINHNARDTTASFGFGRRICPGRHLATSTTFLTITHRSSSVRHSKICTR